MAPRGGALGFSPRLIRYYLPQTQAESNFSGGMCRDLPPTSIPPGFCFDDVDFNLDKPGLAYYRGPLKKYGEPLGGSPSSTGTTWIATPTLNGATYVLACWNGQVYEVHSGSAATARGALGSFPIDRPQVYPNNGTDLLVIPAGNGTSPPATVRITGGVPVVGALGGSPPGATLVANHHNYLVLAGDKNFPNRVYFSPSISAENPWQTGGVFNSFMETSYPITALASVQGVLLVFSENFCERIIGDTPPSNVGENLSLQALGAVGCSSPLSIQPWGANIIFANGKGVFVTNGAGFDSLTDKPNGTGISKAWQGELPAVLGLCGAIYNQKYYIISIGAGFEDTWCCYLPAKAWWRLTLPVMNWSDATTLINGSDEVYSVGGYTNAGNQVVTLSKLFAPLGAGTDEVAFPSARVPLLITRMLGSGLGLKAFEHGHVTLASPGNIQLGYIRGVGMEGIGSGLGAPVPETPFLTGIETSGGPLFQRKRFTLNFDAQGIFLTLSPYLGQALTEVQVLALEAEIREATYGNISDAVYP